MMQNKKWYVSAFLFIVIGVFVGLILSSQLDLVTPVPGKNKISSKSINALSELSEALSEVATVASSSVVNISTTRVIKRREGTPFDFFNDPFFRRFFGDQAPHPDVPQEREPDRERESYAPPLAVLARLGAKGSSSPSAKL